MTPDAAPVNLRLEHRKLLLAQLDAELASQLGAWDQIERKGTTMLGATGVLLGLVVSNSKTFEAYPDPAPALYLIALFVLVAGLVAGVVMIWPRDFQELSGPDALLKYDDDTTEHTVGVLLTTKAEAYKANINPMWWKVRAAMAQMVLLAVAGVLLFLVLVIGRNGT